MEEAFLGEEDPVIAEDEVDFEVSPLDFLLLELALVRFGSPFTRNWRYRSLDQLPHSWP